MRELKVNKTERAIRSGRAIGPRSALTSFLQEQGITARMINEKMKKNQELRSGININQDGDDLIDLDNDSTTILQPNEEVPQDENMLGNDQDQTKSDDSTLPLSKKRKSLPKNKESPNKPEVPANNRKKSLKKGSKAYKYESDVDSNDDFIVPDSSVKNAPGLNKSSARKGGHIEFCSVCLTRFLVRNDVKNSKGAVLCSKCIKSSETSKNTKKSDTIPKPKRTRKKVNKVEGGLLEIDSSIPSLQDLCVRVIGKNIQNVESFGDISFKSMNKVSAIISKLRLLDNNILRLFLAPERTEINLYDCTKIDGDGYKNIAQFCPYLEDINLNFCGKIRDPEILFFANHLKNLRSINLHGPFLVSDEAFAQFFKIVGSRLVSLKISVAQFGLAAVNSLVENCPNLEELVLNQCYSLDEVCINVLSGISHTFSRESSKFYESATEDPQNDKLNIRSNFPKLRILSISDPQLNISSSSLISLLDSSGHTLTDLSFSNCSNADDSLLIYGILKNCTALNSLDISGTSITSAGIVHFFDNFSANNSQSISQENNNSNDSRPSSATKGITHLNLSRIGQIDDEALLAVVRNTGYSLKYLNLHSADELVTEAGVLAIAGISPHHSNDITNDENLDSNELENLDTPSEAKAFQPNNNDLSKNPNTDSPIKEPGTDSTALDAEHSKDDLGAVNSNQNYENTDISLYPCKNLETLVLSFVRVVDDNIIRSIVDNCPRLTEIFINGNPNVTPFAPTREGLTIVGRESDTL
ncbi:DNA repair protein rhp7 [Smittium mucronatum]|uniref:DNA repair protein rhp7 n=1 Tax=Smittium mucronatum TaxID=133383 RepID=A0A1R0H2T4_9FUNG|nr:DNA repair protein rhp7 [Smittium mucronatum]